MTTSVHPALANVPKSTKEALQRILDHAQSHKLARQKYIDKQGNCCAIGLFFTKEQKLEIMKSKSNGLNVEMLSSHFGRENIEAMTGLTLHQADAIQYYNDHAPFRFVKAIKELVTGKIERLEGVKFNV